MKKIFISHRSVDSDVVTEFKDMLVLCGIKQDEIMYTSAMENGLEYQITPEIKQCIKESVVDIIFLSPNYLKSPYCCTEMGAIAMKGTPAIIFGIKGITYENGDGLAGREIYVRNFADTNDLIKVVDIIESKLGVGCTKSSANENATKVVNNYLRVLKYTHTIDEGEDQKCSSEKLLEDYNNQKTIIHNLEFVNKSLNDQLNLQNQLATVMDRISIKIKVVYYIGKRKKTLEIEWKELFFVVFASRSESTINNDNVAYWIKKFINREDKYRISSYDKDITRKKIRIDENFIQRFLQESIALNFVAIKRMTKVGIFGAFNSDCYELTHKGIALLNAIAKDRK